MKIIKEDGLKVLVSISLPYAEVADKVKQKLAGVAQTAKLSGFRPGKVPADIVKQKYGVAVLQEVADEAVKDKFLKDAIEKKIHLAGLLSMEAKDLDFDKEITYELEYETYPKVDAQVPNDLNIETFNSSVSEQDLDDTVQEMRQRLTKNEDTIIGIAASEEHTAIVSYTAKTNDADAHEFSADNTPVDLQGNYPSIEFVTAIKGMRAEEEKTFVAKVAIQGTPTEPGEQASQESQEKDVTFKLKLNKLQRKVLPELNEEFFKQYGVTGGEKEFREKVKSNMEFELQRALGRVKYKAVADAIEQAHPSLQAPETQVVREASRMRDSAIKSWAQMTGNKKPVDTESVSLDMFKVRAATNIKTGLFLGELAKSESLEPSDDEINLAIDDLVQAYDNPAEIKKRYQEDQGLREQIYNKILEDKALDKFMEKSGAKPKEIDYKGALELSSKINQ